MKRRPKGMGTVTYLGTGREKPFVACIKKKSIGTYRTSTDAEKALLCHVLLEQKVIPPFYNNDLKDKYTDFIYEMQKQNILHQSVFYFPSDMSAIYNLFKANLITSGYNFTEKGNVVAVATFGEIANEYIESEKDDKSYTWYRSSLSVLKLFKDICDKPISTIELEDIQKCFDAQSSKSLSFIKMMKALLRAVYKISERKKYTSKTDNPCDYVVAKSSSNKRSVRRIFKPNEIQALFEHDSIVAKQVLVYIYTGCRPNELMKMKREDIHLDENYMIGGSKTDAGRERIIPIHHKIKPIIEELIAENGSIFDTHLAFHTHQKKISEQFKELMHELNLEHDEPYDTRHTFISIANVNGLNPLYIKKIVGHKSNDITEDVYTHIPKEVLIEEMQKYNPFNQ